MAKVKGSKKFREDLPDVVSGVTGEGAIVEEFKKVYNELYNSFDTSEAMRELRGLVQGKVNLDSVLEINLITVEVVQRAVARLKSGKGDITGSYTSDAIKACPDSFFQCLASVFSLAYTLWKCNHLLSCMCFSATI